MEETISVIVPVFNAEKTLRRCVYSLTEQSCRNLEILLGNDGSMDGSLALCRELAGEDERIRVIDKPNGGVSSARNAGLDAAAGKYVMFCDSDDYVEPDWCSAMVANSDENDLILCGIAREDVPCGTERKPLLESAERKEIFHYPMLMCSPVNKLFFRSVIEKGHLRFPEQLSLGEDFVFVLSYLCAISGRLRVLNRNLYNYDTANENSLSEKAPPVQDCDSFYRSVTAAMETLGAMDAESVAARDRLVLTQFERLLTATSRREDLSFREKLTRAGEIGGMEAFRACTTQVITWGSPVYRWLFHHKKTRLMMCFLRLRAGLKGK